jgi:ABC-2 type transport system permease protein
MSARGALEVAGVEWMKLRAQSRVQIVIAACLAGPFAFAAAMRIQNNVPEDTLFGRAVKESGFATSLVVLGFAALWAFPLLASIVGGDVFAAEDRHKTWATILTRSRSRAEVFAGKALTALAFSTLALVILAAASVAAGVFVIGHQPLVDLSGVLLPPSEALGRITLAWVSVLPPVLAFTALSVFLSVATRNSAAGIGLPVVAGLLMQLDTYVDGPDLIRRLFITTAFESWHGLLTEHPYYRPLVRGTAVSGIYLTLCLLMAYRLLRERDVTGG